MASIVEKEALQKMANHVHTGVTLSDVRLSQNVGGEYELSLIYIVETENGVAEIIFPNIPLNVFKDSLPYLVGVEPVGTLGGAVQTINYGFAEVAYYQSPFCKDERKPLYKITVLEERAKEMTLDEIEKQLGHKVKIVSK